MTLVEAMARAICKSKGRSPDECVLGSGYVSTDRDGNVSSGSTCDRYAWQDHRGSAIAALKAIREPPTETLDLAYGQNHIAGSMNNGNFLRALVDAALTEQEQTS